MSKNVKSLKPSSLLPSAFCLALTTNINAHLLIFEIYPEDDPNCWKKEVVDAP